MAKEIKSKTVFYAYKTKSIIKKLLAKVTSYNYKTKILSNYKTIKLLLLTSNYQKEITTNSSILYSCFFEVLKFHEFCGC